MSQPKLTKADVEETLRSFQGGVTDEVENRKQQVIIGAIALVLAVVAITFLLGKRRGRRKSTIVEIRRF